MELIKKNILLILIIILPSVLVLFGLSFGLPLHLIGDEESLVGGAFKMLELKTAVPAQYPVDFRLYYYPPVIAYLILLAASPVILYKFATLGFSVSAVSDYFALNQNDIWLASRFLVLIFSILLLLVVYDLGKRMFNKQIGLIATGLVASSFFYNNLAHWVKHWVFATFFAYLIFLLVYRYLNNQLKNKYTPALAAAVGVATSYITAFGVLVAAIYGVVKRKNINNFFNFVLISLAIGVILGGGLVLLNYPEVFRILGPEDGTITVSKSLVGFFSVLMESLASLFNQELIILATSVLSLIFVARYRTANIVIAIGWFLYLVILYLFFHFEIRYNFFALPALALSGASFIYWALEKLPNKNIRVIVLLLIFSWPVVSAIQYHYLLSKGDTRSAAVDWLKNNTTGEFLMDSELIELDRSKASLALAQQYGRIDAPSRYYLAKDGLNNDGQRYSYQNIHFWDEGSSLNIDQYITELNPKYFVVDYWNQNDLSAIDKKVINRSTLVKKFSQSELKDNYDINGNFYVFNSILFKLNQLGPTVEIYEINY